MWRNRFSKLRNNIVAWKYTYIFTFFFFSNNSDFISYSLFLESWDTWRNYHDDNFNCTFLGAFGLNVTAPCACQKCWQKLKVDELVVTSILYYTAISVLLVQKRPFLRHEFHECRTKDSKLIQQRCRVTLLNNGTDRTAEISDHRFEWIREEVFRVIFWRLRTSFHKRKS